MPLIKFVKNKPSLTVETGANLMKSLLEAGVPVASSCHGDGICARCRITIIEGRENLSPQNTRELVLREQNSLSKEIRISCQTAVLGDITIDASYW